MYVEHWKIIKTIFYDALQTKLACIFYFNYILFTPEWLDFCQLILCLEGFLFFIYLHITAHYFITDDFKFFFFSIIFISRRLNTLQYCSEFCHTLTWTSHGFICVPHPEPPSHLPPHPIPLGLPSAPAPSTCIMHPTWTGDMFHTW